ncbi:MAG: ABC transporter ATP-binding protein [Lentisphaeria bacterium]|nr:ABC transporter ATP-binding protein [Candidatus Neomarinimicrobiota bacterium]MCF7843009.1 ABC transporter ATP-binding protein [Lentisphaeria bacterium]
MKISTEPIITARNLRKHFGSFVAVNSVDFDIPAGICYGFLGPNGAGKTSTMKMIYCAAPVTSGNLTVVGHDVMREMKAVKSQIGVVSQEDSLDYELDVWQNLLVFARYFDIPRKTAEKRADEVIQFLQLEEKRHVGIREMSGGMKRRLQIGRALMNRPRVLILDEPTTGLDPQARHHVWGKLHDLKAQGVTLILTTHYMDEAEQLCDTLVIMDRGNIISEGNPWTLIQQHIPYQVVEIRATEEAKTEILSRFANAIGDAENLSDRLLIYTSKAEALLLDIQEADVPTKTIMTRRATLEDVFLKLTGRELID